MAVVSPTTSIWHGTPAIGKVNVELPPSFSFFHISVRPPAYNHSGNCSRQSLHMPVRLSLLFLPRNLQKLCRFRLRALHLRYTPPVLQRRILFCFRHLCFSGFLLCLIVFGEEPQPVRIDRHIQKDNIIVVNFLLFHTFYPLIFLCVRYTYFMGHTRFPLFRELPDQTLCRVLLLVHQIHRLLLWFHHCTLRYRWLAVTV